MTEIITQLRDKLSKELKDAQYHCDFHRKEMDSFAKEIKELNRSIEFLSKIESDLE